MANTPATIAEAVTRTGSQAKAARALGIKDSTVSVALLRLRVRTLEKDAAYLQQALNHAVHRNHRDTSWCDGCALVRKWSL